MDDFRTIVKNNGIIVPSTFFRSIMFQLRWKSAEKAYKIFEEKYIQREAEWNNYREGLKIDWGRVFPTFSMVFKMPRLSFKDPEEAILAITGAQRSLDSFSMNEEFQFQDKLARSAWFYFDVLSKAPKNCKLIVIREVNYEPSRDQMSQFEAAIAEYKPYSIYLSNGKIIWLAFNPQNHFSELNNLKVSAQFCKVEYLN